MTKNMTNRKRTSKRNKKSRMPGVSNLGITRPIRPREQKFSTNLSGYVGIVDISASGLKDAYFTTIGGFPNSTGFLSVFDQYRILEVTYTFIPQCVTSFITSGTVATVAPTGVYNTSILATCVDQDDANTPTNENTILQHESSIVHGPFVTPISRTYKPMVAASVYQTGGFGGYSSQSDAWLDSASTNIQHYGLKWSLSHGTPCPTGTVYMSVYVEAMVEFRKVF